MYGEAICIYMFMSLLHDGVIRQKTTTIQFAFPFYWVASGNPVLKWASFFFFFFLLGCHGLPSLKMGLVFFFFTGLPVAIQS